MLGPVKLNTARNPGACKTYKRGLYNLIINEVMVSGFVKSAENLTAEGKIVYENPFKSARLSNEEIAIATCLLNMKKYLETGVPFYSLKEAALDSKIFLSV